MELNFTTDLVTNFYVNFGIQTVAHINYASFFLINFILFYVFCITLIFELKFIEKICQKIGVIEAREGQTVKPSWIRSCSDDALSSRNFFKEQRIKVRKQLIDKIVITEVSSVSQYDTKTLLKTILKYHVNAIA